MSFDDITNELRDLQFEVSDIVDEYSWIDRVSRAIERAGSDSTDSVHTTLDADNFPERVHVSGDWQSRLSGHRLDDAVMEAATAAYLDGWARAAAEVERLRSRGERAEHVTYFTTPEVPTERSLEELIGDVLTESAKLSTSAPAAPEQVTRASNRRVSFALTKYGITTCQIDQDWASRKAHSQLATEVNTALADAKTAFNEHRRTQSESPMFATATQLIALLHSFATPDISKET